MLRLLTVALISHARKVMLKFSKPGFNSIWALNFQMYKLDLEKTKKNQRSNCQHPLDHRKAKELKKKIYLCFIDYTKASDYVDHNKLENS